MDAFSAAKWFAAPDLIEGKLSPENAIGRRAGPCIRRMTDASRLIRATKTGRTVQAMSLTVR
jgi:hypothetical protein